MPSIPSQRKDPRLPSDPSAEEPRTSLRQAEAGRTRAEREQAAAETARDAASREQAVTEASLRDAQVAQRNLQNFLAMVAHDLRTPLTSISGYAQMLAHPNLSSDARDRALATIRRETARMEMLINDIVDAGRLGVGNFVLRPRTADLVALAREIVEAQQATTERHEIALEAPDRLAGSCDVDRLGQVLTNLVANAIKYSPAGGPIRVCLRREGGQAVINVSDVGVGIRPEDLPLLFQPFSRLYREAGLSGAGLGLYISRGITEAHGGQLRAESMGPGRGATFTCTLPLDREERSEGANGR